MDGYHHIGVFIHDNVEVDAFRGWVEDVSVVLLRPRNGFFDVGCIYGPLTTMLDLVFSRRRFILDAIHR